jgi:hypothetical protein
VTVEGAIFHCNHTETSQRAPSGSLLVLRSVLCRDSHAPRATRVFRTRPGAGGEFSRLGLDQQGPCRYLGHQLATATSRSVISDSSSTGFAWVRSITKLAAPPLAATKPPPNAGHGDLKQALR